MADDQLENTFCPGSSCLEARLSDLPFLRTTASLRRRALFAAFASREAERAGARRPMYRSAPARCFAKRCVGQLRRKFVRRQIAEARMRAHPVLNPPKAYQSNTPSASPRPALNPPWAASATATTMLRRNDQRSLQGRGHPPARPLAFYGSRRVRHARMGGLVQQPAASRSHRRPARRGRRRLLYRHGETVYRSVTQTK